MTDNKQDQEGEVSWGRGGWLRYTPLDAKAPAVYVRLEEEDGRLVPMDVFAAGARPLDVETLRRVPLGAIQAEANAHPRFGGDLRIPGPDVRTLVSYFQTTFGPASPDHWVKRSLDAQLPGTREPQPPKRPLRGNPSPRPALTAADARLDVPPRRPYPDSFYQEVAAVHNVIAGRVPATGAFIADANEVPVSTAHRWIKQARARGFLKPGRVGKAG